MSDYLERYLERYLESVDGEAHHSAVAIIKELEQQLAESRKKLENYAYDCTNKILDLEQQLAQYEGSHGLQHCVSIKYASYIEKDLAQKIDSLTEQLAKEREGNRWIDGEPEDSSVIPLVLIETHEGEFIVGTFNDVQHILAVKFDQKICYMGAYRIKRWKPINTEGL